jgi:hypothetical protein
VLICNFTEGTEKIVGKNVCRNTWPLGIIRRSACKRRVRQAGSSMISSAVRLTVFSEVKKAQKIKIARDRIYFNASKWFIINTDKKYFPVWFEIIHIVSYNT